MNVDGSRDVTFVADTDYSVNAVALQTDGKLVIGGSFQHVEGLARKYVARLKANGSVDPTFIPAADVVGIVKDLIIQSDGKVLTAALPIPMVPGFQRHCSIE